MSSMLYSTSLEKSSHQTLSITDDTLLTLKEATSYLRVCRCTLYRLMGSGQLTGYKVGRTWRFYRADLRACIQAEALSPTT